MSLIGHIAQRGSRLCGSISPSLTRYARQTSRMASTGASTPGMRAAVILSGNGVFDGAEIQESVSVLMHLSRAGASTSIFAPDIPQKHVIDHTKGEEMQETRNVLKEAARIARGKIAPLSDLVKDSSNYDSLIFPGGFGAAKNLSTFAFDGPDATVNEEVAAVVKKFHADKKPIGFCCISPVIAAKLIPGCELTVGFDESKDGRFPYADTAGAIISLGCKHVNKEVTDIHTDEKNRIVSTPAYMCEAKPHEIYDGIGKLVQQIVKMT